MRRVVGLGDHVLLPVPLDRSLLKNSQCRQSLAGSPLQVRGFSYFRLYFGASAINGAVSQCTYPAAAAPLLQHSDDFPASSSVGALVKAGKIPVFQSGGLDGYLSNPASIGGIPLHSLPHVLQEQMNGTLANGSGYQSDSSATQSPPQALWVPSKTFFFPFLACERVLRHSWRVTSPLHLTSIKEEQEDEEICDNYPYESAESMDEHGHSPDANQDEGTGSPERPNLHFDRVPSLWPPGPSSPPRLRPPEAAESVCFIRIDKRPLRGDFF